MHARNLMWMGTVLAALCGCVRGDLPLNVRLDRPEGLAPGSPVVAGEQVIGKVEAVRGNAAEGYVAQIVIEEEHRSHATTDTEFWLAVDPLVPGRKRIELVRLRPEGTPLADGTTVQARNRATGLFPLQQFLDGLSESFRAFRGQVEQFRGQMETLPRSDEAQRLREEWQRLRREMLEAERAVDESMREELLPKLEQELDQLRRDLEELQRRSPQAPAVPERDEVRI